MSARSGLLIVGSDEWVMAQTSGAITGGIAGGIDHADRWAADDREAIEIADRMDPTARILALTVVDMDPTAATDLAANDLAANDLAVVDLAANDHPVVDPAAVREVRYLRRGPDGRHKAVLRRPDTAEALDLLPHPEGGWYRETWRSDLTFTPPGYPGERAVATAIHFLLPPGEESIWHAVRSDELWLWHGGGRLAMMLGGDGDRPDSGHVEELTLGGDVRNGELPQVVVPAGTWQSARPAGDDEVLVSCVVAPGFDFADFRVPA